MVLAAGEFIRDVVFVVGAESRMEFITRAILETDMAASDSLRTTSAVADEYDTLIS